MALPASAAVLLCALVGWLPTGARADDGVCAAGEKGCSAEAEPGYKDRMLLQVRQDRGKIDLEDNEPFCCVSFSDEADPCGSCYRSAVAPAGTFCASSADNCKLCGMGHWCSGSALPHFTPRHDGDFDPGHDSPAAAAADGHASAGAGAVPGQATAPDAPGSDVARPEGEPQPTDLGQRWNFWTRPVPTTQAQTTAPPTPSATAPTTAAPTPAPTTTKAPAPPTPSPTTRATPPPTAAPTPAPTTSKATAATTTQSTTRATPRPTPSPTPAPTTTTVPATPAPTPSSASGTWYTGTWTTGYWDCCKPSCAWAGKGNVNKPARSCDASGATLADAGATSVCDGGTAASCVDYQPFLVKSSLAMGFTAAAVSGNNGLTGDANCGQCYELKFTAQIHPDGNWGGSNPGLVGKSIVVQVTNIGYDVTGDHSFDIQIPAAGQGAFTTGCTRQFPGTATGDFDCANPYGGCNDKSGCAKLPAVLQPGCAWRYDWYLWLVSGGQTNNPYVDFRRVRCPTQLTSISGSIPNDDAQYPAIDLASYS